jgi:predicted RNA-binding Zn-ribbon protein involved in translation (DUF1610 family)
MNTDNNLKASNDANKDSGLPSFKPTKRVSPETDNHLIKMLDAMVNGLEQSLGKRTYLCGNPDCGALIIFHSSEPRPRVCIRCGIEIDWEGEYITRIKVCPKCNKEYDTGANYCAFHIPPFILIEREVEK